MDALAFLDKPPRMVAPVYVVCGDSIFLRQRVLEKLREILLEDADPAFAWTVYTAPGRASAVEDDSEDAPPTESAHQVPWSAVRGDLDTVPFLSPRRVVVIERADSFVSQYRAVLEKYVAQPSSQGVLILEVKTWPSNTRLAKSIPTGATLLCKVPAPQQLTAWCVSWAKSQYHKKLQADAAATLLELIGPDMGQMDQELAKLAIYVGDADAIQRADVDRLVGRSRAAEVFKIFDAIGAGQAPQALVMLERLLDQGEEPLKILGAFSWQLRRLARLGQHVRQGHSLRAACADETIPPFAVGGLQALLNHLGPERVQQLFDWLVETDLGLKSSDSLPRSVLLERLLVRLARPRSAD